jgi:hypothetical protein
MITEYMLSSGKRTLAQRLSEGRLPTAEALRYAVQLAEALRKLHDTGRFHGAVNPSNLLLVAGVVELQPAIAGTEQEVTPYTAPEVVRGLPADARSDVFGFGAVLFELMTGRRAFLGEGRAALATSLAEATVPGSGSPAVDRLVGPCLNKNPDARSANMRKVALELKLLSVAVRHVVPGALGAPHRDLGAEITAVRAEMAQMEARLSARLEVQARRASEMNRAGNEAVNSLRSQISAMHSELAVHHEEVFDRQGGALGEAGGDAMLARAERAFEALTARIAQIERTVDEIRRHHSEFEHNIAADLVDLEQSGKAQSVAIESARTAMSQTDDLVERVVEALEALQTAVLEQSEGGGQPNFAVN